MITKLAVYDKKISVQFEEHVVRITTDDELTGLLQHHAEAATDELATAIKTEYQKQTGSEFTVSHNSIAVEIWGHVYADEFAGWLKKISSIHLIDKMTDMVIDRAGRIDIGEHGHDSNRFVWDGLSVVKSAIALFLPK